MKNVVDDLIREAQEAASRADEIHKARRCWVFFHQWTRWGDRERFKGSDFLQEKRCVRCGKVLERFK